MVAQHKKKSLVDAFEKINMHLRHTGGRITPVRREVLEALLKQKKSKTAYQLLVYLNKNRNPQLSAISHYSTLGFLMELRKTFLG